MFSPGDSGAQGAHNILDISKTTAVAPSLPPEILARIFSEAACDCTGATGYDHLPPTLNPATISAVCKQWRSAVLSYQSLWTHLDLQVYSLDTDRGYYSPKLWMERSQGASLDIHIRQYRQFGDSGTHDVKASASRSGDQPSGPMVTRLNDFLQPLMPQVRSLTLIICWPSYDTLNKLLAGWTAFGASGQASVLKIQSNPKRWASPIAPTIYFDSSLDSLEILHLDVAVPSWSNLALSNLTVLHLDAGYLWWTITQSALASVLTSCPKLRWLALTDLGVDNSTQPAPSLVLLDELQVLDIGSGRTSVLASILAIISPGNNSLRLKISLFHGCLSPDEVLSEMHPFLNKANVNVCELANSGMPCFALQLGSLPRVQTLILKGWFFCDYARLYGYRIQPGTYGEPLPIDPDPVHWSHLKKLYLDDCVLEKRYLYQLLSRHSISALYMRNCYHGNEAEDDFRMSPQTYEEYARLLSEVVPEVTYAEGGRGPWPLLSS